MRYSVQTSPNLEAPINDSIEDEPLEELSEINTYIEGTLNKLDMIQKVKILLTLINYGTKAFALYSCYFDFLLFSQNSLLLFSYLLYALLELVALSSALAFIIISKVVSLVFQLHTYYMDSMICLPILYNVFRFCFIVTFFVQSVALFLFADLHHWGYSLLLASSLLLILVLEFLRIILMCGGKLALTSHCCDMDNLLKKFLNKKYFKSVSVAKLIITKIYKLYLNLNPDVKRKIKLAFEVKDKAIELKNNYDWIKKKYMKHKEDLRSHSIYQPQSIEMNTINTNLQASTIIFEEKQEQF